MLNSAEEIEYQELRLKVLEQSGKRAGLAKCVRKGSKEHADPAEKVRLRELIAKRFKGQ